jgi:hypothetical protein
LRFFGRARGDPWSIRQCADVVPDNGELPVRDHATMSRKRRKRKRADMIEQKPTKRV